MTAAEYLTARGWVASSKNKWADPLHASAPWASSDSVAPFVEVGDAMIIQQARDAAEERAAWVQFAAAAISGANKSVKGIAATNGEHWNIVAGYVKGQADSLLDEFKQRFAVELKP
jgi:CelD/BcsL family acetyltransferase involved in cellulose biosynthesis